MSGLDGLDGLAACRSKEAWLSPIFRSVLDTLPAQIFIAHDPDCRMVTGNRAACALMRAPVGCNISRTSPEQQTRGKMWVRDHRGRSMAIEDTPLRRAARGEETHSCEVEIVFEDGTNTWLLGDAVPLYDDDGSVWGAVGAFLDITARKRAEEELGEVSRMKARFLASVSHDLRQPVQALELYREILAGMMPDRAAPILDKMQACVSTLTIQLGSLIDLSRADAGAMPVKLGPIAVQDVLDRLRPNIEPIAQAKGLTIRFLASSARIRTDGELLERLLANLIGNAVKYTRQGRVLVGCRRVRGRLAIQVWDTGPGIAHDQLESIFTEYFRADGSGQQGAGLGLATVDRIARILGTPVTVRSDQGKGSVFAVEVPLVTG